MDILFFCKQKALVPKRALPAGCGSLMSKRLKISPALQALMVVAVILLIFVKGLYGADIRESIRGGMKALLVKKGDPGLCVVTDAVYVRLKGEGCGRYVDLIQEETGCSVGKGNLLVLHRPATYPLKIVLFCNNTKACVAIGSEDGKWVSKRYDIGLEALSKKDSWQKIGGPLAPDGFAVATVCHAWSAGVPEDLLKCAELHGHLCPGVTAGYMIARFILEHYPRQAQDQYRWIAGPVNCKEDAIQVLLDLTPGKKTLLTQKLTTDEEERLTGKKAAGILVVWNSKENRGKGIVLGFDWDKASEKDKLCKLLNMLPYVERPDEFVPVIKEFDVTLPIMEKLTKDRSNPYEWLGLMK